MGILLKTESNNPVDKFIISNHTEKRRLIYLRSRYNHLVQKRKYFLSAECCKQKRLRAFAVAGGFLKKTVWLNQDDKKVL